MQQTTETNYYSEETINLKDIIDKLIASKKLIIIITLLSTILAFYYSSSRPTPFTSNALIEIGNLNLISLDDKGRPKYLIQGKKALIENPEILVRELNILFAHKKHDEIHGIKLSFSIIENRLIGIKATASSSEIGINSLNIITSYILDRHKKILNDNAQKNFDLINTSLEAVNDEIEFQNERKKKLIENIKKDNEAELSIKLTNTEKRIGQIIQLLPSIDKKINALEVVISEDTQNLKLLETDPKLLKERAAIPPTLSEVIYLYKNSIIDFETQKYRLESELKNLQDSLSDIKKALGNNNEDSAVFNKKSLASKLTEKQIYLNDSINRLNDAIFKLLQEKNIQEKNLQTLMAKTTSNSALIGEITSVQTKLKTIKFTLIGFILGMFLSAVLVLIIGKLKAYKEENVIAS